MTPRIASRDAGAERDSIGAGSLSILLARFRPPP